MGFGLWGFRFLRYLYFSAIPPAFRTLITGQRADLGLLAGLALSPSLSTRTLPTGRFLPQRLDFQTTLGSALFALGTSHLIKLSLDAHKSRPTHARR